MKIRKLKIKNYKIFDDVEFDFTDAEGKALNTVVLAGVNGCGKTTVLEIIGKFFNHNFSSEFDQSEIEIELEITLTKAEWKLTNMVFGLEDFAFSDNTFETRYVKFNVSHIDFFNLNNTLIQGMPTSILGVYFPIKAVEHMSANFAYLIISEISRDIKDAKGRWLKIARDEVFKNKDLPPKKAIENQIQRLTSALSGLDLNTRLVDLESEELVFESANGQRIYFEQLSHGEQHLYFRAIYLSQLNLKDALIMVDEPETAFHPTWQQKIAQLYRNVGENNQVFMATHSPHIMASVPPECLFMLHIEESEGKRKIRVINAAKAGKHSQGLEPDRILKEIMQVKTLRDYETQQDIDELTRLLTLEAFESNQAVELAENLTVQLGREDPFIIRLEHQLLILRRKKSALSVA
jgi:predicted ATP-binding protein involved in virulence